MPRKVNVKGKGAERIEIVGRPARRITPSEFAAALGAEPLADFAGVSLDPITLAEVGNELLKRLRSAGSKPSAQEPTESCKVPLSKDDIAALEEIVTVIGRETGTKPTVGQLAGAILEMHLRDLQNKARKRGA